MINSTILDLICIEKYGMTPDYFNEFYGAINNRGIEQYWKENRSRVLSGNFKTYSERYHNNPEILNATDPELLVKVDEIGAKYKQAVQNNEFGTAQNFVTALAALYEARKIIADLELSRQ